MSATEILVVGFGLFIGYWIVSRLMAEKPQRPPPSGPSADARAAATPDPPLAWHQILEISPQASVDEIRDAYKKLMGQYHPDKVASLGPELQAVAERKSKEITEAYRMAMHARGAEA
jgi:DnaJ-domain-containing protein 1